MVQRPIEDLKAFFAKELEKVRDDSAKGLKVLSKKRTKPEETEPKRPKKAKEPKKAKKEEVEFPEPAAKEEEEGKCDDQRGRKAKGWFLTWPQCPITKEECLRQMEERLAPLQIKEYVIAEEKHEDGSPHLHAFIKVSSRIRFKKDRFDMFQDGEKYHGNYQVAKSWIAVKKYVSKEEYYIANIDVQAAMKKQSKMKKEDLLRDIDDLLDEEVITPMQVASFAKNQAVYKMMSKRNRPKMPEIDPPKQRHHWIYGESNSGKTMALRKWIKEHGEDNCFQIPYNNDWVGYEGQKYLYADEFKGQLSIQELNRICDGGAKVNIKGATTILAYGCEVYLCSNYDIESCYKNADKVIVQALYNRFILEKRLWDPDYERKNLPQKVILSEEVVGKLIKGPDAKKSTPRKIVQDPKNDID